MYELVEFKKREQTQRYIYDVIRYMARNGNLSYTELKTMKPRPYINPVVAPPIYVDIADQELAMTEATQQIHRDRNMQRVQQEVTSVHGDIMTQDPVVNLIGQPQGQASGSSDDPNKVSDAEVFDSGLTSGIIAEDRRIIAEVVIKKYKSSSTVQALNARIVRAIAENRGIQTVKREAGPNTLEHYPSVKFLADLLVLADED